VRTRNAARSTDLATDFLRLRYHGHAGEQHADGLFGALVISSEEDDEAAGRATLTTASAADGGDEAAADDAMEWVWVLSDMYDAPAATLAAAYLAPGGGVEPTPDAIAVNGVRADDAAALAGFNATARRGGADAAPVRLRLVNAATASTFLFSADATPLTLLELDGGGISAAMPPLRAITLVPGQRAAVLLNFPSVSTAAAVCRSPRVYQTSPSSSSPSPFLFPLFPSSTHTMGNLPADCAHPSLLPASLFSSRSPPPRLSSLWLLASARALRRQHACG
jgi:FtsP/CotA-like multicopper oxidase with cupredoxin domain